MTSMMLHHAFYLGINEVIAEVSIDVNRCGA